MHIAAFVTPHGFGHAGRMSALLDALHARRPDLTVAIFTTVPEAFLGSSLRAPHRIVSCRADVGMVQRGPFRADLEATATAVTEFLDGLPDAAESAARQLRASGCDVVLCDISPLGLVAAARAGIPSVLIENFRWEWIYSNLPDAPGALRGAAERLAEISASAGLHIQAAPACDRAPGAVRIDRPFARAARARRERARSALGLGPDERVVLITTGGVTDEQRFVGDLVRRPDVTFVVTGGDRSARSGHLVRIAVNAPLYLPDLVRASDAVVAKLGYSTLAEVWREGRPLAWIVRDEWPESPTLSAWATQNVSGFELDHRAFDSGDWLERLDDLLEAPSTPPRSAAGQDDAAALILGRL